MNIFIETYHMVNNIIHLPKKIIDARKEAKIKQELLLEKEERQKKLLQETANTISSTSNVDKLLEDKNADKTNLITFNYQVKSDTGKIIKSSFDAKSISEVEAFLINEGYEIIKIEPRKKFSLDMNISLFGTHFKSNELSFALTQLSTYIKSGIPLVDSVRILARQTENASKRKVYEKIIYDLVAGESFSTALENQSDVFPRLLINMVKTSEMTGDLPTTLDEMSDYYTSIDQTKRQMITALTYPIIILIVSLAVVIFCLVYIVPSFVKMYGETETSLQAITVFTMNMSSFVSQYYIIIISIVTAILIMLITAYKNIKSCSKMIQFILMKTPLIGNIIIYCVVSMFT